MIEFDFDSCAKNDLFVQITMGFDSMYKNQRLFLREINGKYKLYNGNWDNDYNFYWWGTLDIRDELIPNHIRNDLSYENQRREYYRSIKSVWNEDYLINYIKNKEEYFLSSGALIRDESLWIDTYKEYAILGNYLCHKQSVNLLIEQLPLTIEKFDQIFLGK